MAFWPETEYSRVQRAVRISDKTSGKSGPVTLGAFGDVLGDVRAARKLSARLQLCLHLYPITDALATSVCIIAIMVYQCVQIQEIKAID